MSEPLSPPQPGQSPDTRRPAAGSPPGSPPAWGQPPAPGDWRYAAGVLTPPPSPAPTGWAPFPPPSAQPVRPAVPRASRATLALLLSLGGLLACGVPSVFGMLVARAEIDAMNRGIADSSRRSRAEAAFAFGILGTVQMVLMSVLWVTLAWMGAAAP